MKTYSYKELENEKYIKLSNEYFNSKFIKKYSIDSILILSILLKNYTNRGEIVFSLNYIFTELNIAKTNTNRMNKVKQILNSLVKGKVFNTDIDFMNIKNDDIVRVSYNLVDKNFTMVYDFEVEEILNADTTADKYAMFYLFVFIKYRLNTSTKVMFWSIKNMCKEMNTKSNKTVMGYIDVLEEIRLIKVGKVGTRVFLDGSTKKANNIYTVGYLADTDNILQKQMDSYKEQLEEKQVKLEQGKKAGKQTSIKLRLNTLWKKYNDEDITDDEIEELKKLQKKYYEFIKLDEEKVENTPFIIFDDDDDEVITKAMTTEKEDKPHFGLPNPLENRKVDYETGEIIEDEIGNEQNVSDTITFSDTDGIVKTSSANEHKGDNVDAIDVLSHFGNLKEVNKDNKKKVERTVDEIIKEYCKITEFDYDVVKNFISNIELDDSFYNADKEEQRDAIKEILMNYQYEIEIMQMNKIEQKRKEDEKERSIANYVPESIRYTQEQEFHNDDEDEFLDLMS